MWQLSICYVAMNSCAIISALHFGFKQENKARINITASWGTAVAIFFAVAE